MNHTKEPWIIDSDRRRGANLIRGGKAKMVAWTIYFDNGSKTELANAKRIVACVNACKGLTNEVLDEGILDDAIALVLNAGKDIGVTWDGAMPYYEGVKVWEVEAEGQREDIE